MTGGGVEIRPATPADHDAIWAILEPVYRAGETYCIPQDISRGDALADWFAPPFTAFVAIAGGRVLGTSHVGANRPGGGSHVANASFATHPDARGVRNQRVEEEWRDQPTDHLTPLLACAFWPLCVLE